MDLSPEICSLIVTYVGNRADMCTLTRVSKKFQAAAERALYNTLAMTDPDVAETLCTTLLSRERLSPLVVALTISLDNEEESDGNDISYDPSNYWNLIHRALQRTTRLRYLNIFIESGCALDAGWVLNNCTFHLYAFHCDLVWENNLATFLSTQSSLSDLQISDYNDHTPANTILRSQSIQNTTPSSCMPNLTTLECTFVEAVALLAPRRPISRVKTCLSRTRPVEKRAEVEALVASLRLATAPLRSLSVPDSSYSSSFTLELLSHIVRAFQPDPQLSYLGPFVLPVDGEERLKFYGLLRRLPLLRCTELETTSWEPAPVRFPALRALASELRIYVPSIDTVIFLYDFEQTVVRLRRGKWVEDVSDNGIDDLWRDI